VVEGTGLENRQTCKRFEGSNPSPSAILLRATRFAGLAEPLAPRQVAPEVLAKEGIASGIPQAHAIHRLDQARLQLLFQGRKRLRLDDCGLMMKAAPKRHGRHEDRQNGDQTHTHY
jgi:hypothetical protein